MATRRRNTDPARQTILKRIRQFEEAVAKANEFLQSGKHADWPAFRPLFTPKLRDGEHMPPHRDWVKNVFLRRMERSLKLAERALDTLEQKTEHTARSSPRSAAAPRRRLRTTAGRRPRNDDRQ